MSATPNNAGAGWIGAPSEPEQARENTLRDGGLSEAGAGRDALQALLAFASLQEQASRKRSQAPSEFSQDDLALNEVLGLVAARALSITGADGIAIALAHENAIVCRASAGKIAPDRGARLDPNYGFSGICLRSGESIRCDDSESDPRVNPEACSRLGTRSMIASPLSAKQRVIGLIEAFSSEPFGFNETDVRSLKLLGELILAAIRPEEEDRMAELAGQIVIPQPQAVTAESEAAPSEPAATLPQPMLVDEKFTPAVPQDQSAKTAPVAAETPVATEQREAEPAEASRPEAEPDFELPAQSSDRSFVGAALIAALVLAVAGLGWGVYAKMRHAEQSISASTRSANAGQPSGIPEPSQPPITPLKPGATPRVTALHHSSSAQASTVILDLEDQVQYESHTLENPPRIYFDLHDTMLTSSLLNSSIDVDDTFIKRIRVAQASPGITRVVVETKGDLQFSVRLDPNPYRLTIDVHKPAASAPAPMSITPLPKPSPAIEPKKKAAGIDASELKIVLDAGHGGWDLGTVGRKGLLEKDLVLDIVARLGSLISDRLGSQIIYTRQDDSYLPLEKRAEIANLAHADLFLSVHANYSDLETARGVETFYTNTYSSVKARTDDPGADLQDVNWTGVDIRAKVMESRRLAGDVQKSLYGELVARNPEIRNRGVKKAEYVVLTGTQMPAVLAEVSFVSSPADEDKLQNSEYRQRIAEALYRGVVKYWQQMRHSNLAKAVN
jgi:N-acetylmuramoyl-L-alanine amidase